VQWGDVFSGYAFRRARNALLALEKEQYYPKNWRPSILTLSGLAGSRMHLIKYAHLLSANRGIVSLAQIIIGELADMNKKRVAAEKLMRDFIRKEKLPAVPVVVVDENMADGFKSLLQCHGIGGLKPNILLFGWSNDPQNHDTFSSILHLVRRMKHSCLILSSNREDDQWESPSGAINIWWSDEKNGAMMLLLGHLLKENREWRDCPLRILRPVPPKADVENVEKEMNEIISGGRIEAEIIVLPGDDPLSAIRDAISPSAVLFAGFEPDKEKPAAVLMPFMKEIVDLPGDVILTYNAGDVSLSD
jgi:hypothetical protein